jgi:hypothetical protein
MTQRIVHAEVNYPVSPSRLHSGGIERFHKKWMWPMFSDPTIELEYKTYKNNMEKALGFVPIVTYISIFFMMQVAYIINFKPDVGFLELDVAFQVAIIVGTICCGLHVALVFCFVCNYLKNGFSVFNPNKWTKILLGPCIVLLCTANSTILLARCIHGKCLEGETGIACNPYPDSLPIGQAFGAAVLPVLTSFVHNSNYEFSITFLAVWISGAMIIVSTVIVGLPPRTYQTVIYSCFTLYACLLNTAYKDMNTFEYYRTAEKYLKEQLQHTKASRSRAQATKENFR